MMIGVRGERKHLLGERDQRDVGGAWTMIGTGGEREHRLRPERDVLDRSIIQWGGPSFRTQNHCRQLSRRVGTFR
jgi:hypothetical protein